MFRPLRSVLRFVTVFVAASVSLTAQIPWSDSLSAALEEARERKVPVAISIRMPGERASDRLTHDAKRQRRRLTELAEHTVNLLIEVGPNAERRSPDENVLRERWLGLEGDDVLPVPLHVFLAPDAAEGEILSSIAFDLTLGQLEWAWVDAVQRVRPDVVWEHGDDARAPERIRFGDVEPGVEPTLAPTDDELEHALDEVKKSGGRGGRRGGRGGNAFRRAFEHIAVIVRSPEKSAVKYGESVMRSLGGFGLTARVLRTIGDHSPPAWAPVVASMLEDRAEANRMEAARALEQLRDPKTAKAVMKQLGAEENDDVRARLVRTLGAVGDGNKRAEKLIARLASEDKVDAIRAQAVVAALSMHDDEALLEVVQTALADTFPDVRKAAAYVAAARRDTALLDAVEERASTESDAETKALLDAAIEAVRERKALDAFDEFRKDVLGDRLERRALDAESLGAGGEGDGRGRDQISRPSGIDSSTPAR